MSIISSPLILKRSLRQLLELEHPSISIVGDKRWMLRWNAKARPTKIFNVVWPSGFGTASKLSTNTS